MEGTERERVGKGEGRVRERWMEEEGDMVDERRDRRSKGREGEEERERRMSWLGETVEVEDAQLQLDSQTVIPLLNTRPNLAQIQHGKYTTEDEKRIHSMLTLESFYRETH